MSRNISYFKNKGVWYARQELDDISLYSMEGSLDDFVKFAQKKRKDINDMFVKKGFSLYADYKDCPSGKGEKRVVCFSVVKIESDLHPPYDESAKLRIMGERVVELAERMALEAEEAAAKQTQDDRQRAEFERLKKLYDKGK